MATSSNFNRCVKVNGQNMTFKDYIEMCQTQNYGSDILQHTISNVTPDNSVPSSVNCNTNLLISTEEGLSVIGDSSGRNEYVVLTGEQNTEDVSTIRLTLEQAAELGLHFTVDNTESNLLLNSDCGSKELHDNSDSFINSKAQINHTDETDCLKLDQEASMPCNLSQDIELLNKDSVSLDSSYLDSFHALESNKNQQLTLVPHIVNGTVTYTLQLTSETLGETSNNEFLSINESSIVCQGTRSAGNDLKLDLGSISTSSDLPFINSPVDMVNNKNDDISSDNTHETIISNHTYDLVSCTNSNNMTFLSLSDAIPSNISNFATHINNITTQIPRSIQKEKSINNLGRTGEAITKQKSLISRGGESLLLKQRKVSSTQNGNNIYQTHSLKSKSIEKANTNNHLSLPIQSILPESSNTNLNVCIEHDSSSNSRELLNTNEDIKNTTSEVHPTMSHEQKSLLHKNCGKTSESYENIQAPTVITPNKGDVPTEVSVALSRLPIKSDNKKPLGSTENPIKLVQQGTTFHSMQALTDDHISKIKPILQENFESAKTPSRNVVYDPASNTRIIYRIISPAEVSLRKQDEFPRRRGRPKKVRSTDSQPDEAGEGAPQPKKMFPRTRSGRLSRPPKHMVRDYKHLRRAELDDSDGAYSDYQSDHGEDHTAPIPEAPVDLLPGLVAKRKSNKRNISAGNLCPTCGKIYLGYVRMKHHFDKYPDHGSIEYLNTIRNSHPDSEAENQRLEGGNGIWKKGGGKKKGKGRNICYATADKCTRLKEAMGWCKSREVAEIAGPAVASVLSLWELLLLRVDAVKQDSRVGALYHEMCQLTNKLRQMASRLFRPLDHPLPPGSKHVTVQVEDEIMTGILDLPCGVYLASDEDLNETPVEKDAVQENQISEDKTEDKVEEEPKKMDIDEVPQQFMLPGEEMICDTDDRGLVNVDEIVSERLQNFTGSQSSSVDELMKGLNELEQRNKLETDDLMDGFSIVSRRTHVSASTEDLMKSLEHFDSDLNHSDAPSALDRDAFDRVTNVDTLDFEVLSREFHSNNR